MTKTKFTFQQTRAKHIWGPFQSIDEVLKYISTFCEGTNYSDGIIYRNGIIYGCYTYENNQVYFESAPNV